MPARMIPDRPPTTPESERVTYLALARLPEGWTVIHSVAWQAPRKHRQHDGEADFVLLHPHLGLIVLEVKGGGIKASSDGWRSIDRNGVSHRISDPFEQAKDSKFALLEYLKGRQILAGFLPMGHGVVFPDISKPPQFGAAVPVGIVLTKADLADPLAAVTGVAAAFDMQTNDPIDVESIIDALAPTTVVHHLLADDIAEANARLIRLTDEQIGLLRGLRRNRRALILGGAGTGKTVLARHKALELAHDGASVLLACFNRPLADHLAASLSEFPQIAVSTFHGFCRTEILQAGHQVPEEPTQEWWDNEAAIQLVEALETSGRRVDAIVLDEGQDFAPDWFSALHLALGDPDDAPLYVFADAHQSIYRQDWEPPFDATVFELEINCRNTLPIAQRVAGVFGDAAPGEGSPGLAPEFIEVQNEQGAVARLPGLLNDLIHSGRLGKDQVVVLAQSKDMVTDLQGRTIAGVELVAPGAPGVVVETIHRFKGLEADAAIVILDHIDKDRHRALAYIGISRAKSHLVVIGTPEVRQAIGWR